MQLATLITSTSWLAPLKWHRWCPVSPVFFLRNRIPCIDDNGSLASIDLTSDTLRLSNHCSWQTHANPIWDQLPCDRYIHFFDPVTDIFMVLMSKPSMHDMAIYTSKCTAIENHLLATPIRMIKKEIITSSSIYVLYMQWSQFHL